MYRFSRHIYRELAPHIDDRDGIDSVYAARQDLLRACEATIRRLAGPSGAGSATVSRSPARRRGVPLGERMITSSAA